MTPDRIIVKRLQKIEPTLSVEWVPSVQRWGVFHSLQVEGDYDRSVDLVAKELQLSAARSGHILDHCDCAYAAREAVHAAKLVCYVTEDNGEYRPLDNRIVEKFQRMDYMRRNYTVRDWTQMMDAKAALARASLQRSRETVWDTIRRDKVFANQVSDILWGQKAHRSVSVKGVTV